VAGDPLERLGRPLRRLESIRHLRREDVDFERGTIRWRAEHNKKGREWVVPVPKAVIEELRQFRRRLGALAGWVFAGERKPDRRWTATSSTSGFVWRRNGPSFPSAGRSWHPYRRKWATERKHHAQGRRGRRWW
jgi:integrase